MLHVALKIPLAALDLAGLFQRHDARAPWVEVLHEALDRTALAGGIAPLEQDHHALPSLLDPGLELEQLHLELVFLRLVGAAAHQVPVGVTAITPTIRQLVIGMALAHRSVLGARPGKQCLAQRFTVVPRSALDQCTQGGSTLLRRQIALGQQVLHSGQLAALRRLHGFALHMACHGSLLERRGGIAPARIARALCLGSGRRCAAPTDGCRSAGFFGRRGHGGEDVFGAHGSILSPRQRRHQCGPGPCSTIHTARSHWRGPEASGHRARAASTPCPGAGGEPLSRIAQRGEMGEGTKRLRRLPPSPHASARWMMIFCTSLVPS